MSSSIGFGVGRLRFVKAQSMERALNREAQEHERANQLAAGLSAQFVENKELVQSLITAQEELRALKAELERTSEALRASQSILNQSTTSPDLKLILGKQYFECGDAARYLRSIGQEIGFRPVDEQAAVIHWQLRQYLEHGQRWMDNRPSAIHIESENQPLTQNS